MLKRPLTYLAIFLPILLLSGCGATNSSSPTTTSTVRPSATTPTSVPASTTTVKPTTTTTAPPGPKHPHIFVIVMENLGYRAAMATPQLSGLAHSWAYATNYYATTHPSLPNYLSLIGGSTFGISSDCVSCFVNSANLPTELSQKGVSWTAYMESIPNSCYLSPYAPSGLYAGKHDPFVYFDNVRASTSLCANIKPLSELISRLGSSSSSSSSSARLASFVWITPNICNDGHNCSASTAGSWLQNMVSQITSSPAWKDNGALYVTWDEGNGGDYRGLSSAGAITPSGGGGHVLTLVIEPGLSGGTVLSQPMDHYSLLKTIEDNFGVSQLGLSANKRLPSLP